MPAPDPGILSDLRLAVDLAQEAESFIHTKYHGVLIEFLELRATKLYDAFEKDEIDKAAYFKSAELLKDIAEHPFRLIRGGQVASAKISEWDQQGLTSAVADADASFSQGEHHAG
jgi:hypothetical protein